MITTIDGYYLSINKVNLKDPRRFLNYLKNLYNDVVVQLVDIEAVVDNEHVIEIVKQVLEASKRGVMVSKRIETEILLRIACTNQIKKALEFAGAKEDSVAVLIILSKDKGMIDRITYNLDVSNLEYSEERSYKLIRYHAIDKDELDAILDHRLTSILAERASLIY